MVTVTATEFAKNFGRYREVVQTEAVEVTSHDRVTGYFISRVEYETLQALKQAQREPVEKPKLTVTEKLALFEKIRLSAAAKALPGPDAAHSADFLYDDDGLPG